MMRAMTTDPIVEPRTYLPVRIYTQIGWITGKLAIPEGSMLGAYLDHAGSHLRLVDVALPGRLHPAEFFALHRDAAALIVPETPVPAERKPGANRHAVSVLFEVGMLHGNLDVPGGLRMSDYLSHSTGFLPLLDCRLRYAGTAHESVEPHYSVAYVHPSRAIGFSERQAEVAPVEGLQR